MATSPSRTSAFSARSTQPERRASPATRSSVLPAPVRGSHDPELAVRGEPEVGECDPEPLPLTQHARRQPRVCGGTANDAGHLYCRARDRRVFPTDERLRSADKEARELLLVAVRVNGQLL